MPDIFDQIGGSPDSGQPSPAPAAPTAPKPSGDIFDQISPAQAAPASSTPVPDSLHLGGDPTTLSGGLHNIAAGINSVGAGIGQGVLDTMGGAADIAHKAAKYAGIGEQATGTAANYIHGKQQELEQQNRENPTLNMIGKGTETLMEFVLGDEALKTLPMAQRLEHAAKTMKILEKSPRMMKAAQIAAEAANTGARNAVVQGVQSGVKSGGDLGEAAKGAATAGVLGGALGAAGGALGETLSAAGKAGKKVQELGDIAANAPSKQEVASKLADTINDSKEALHTNYDASVKDYVSRAGDTTVPYKESPFHTAVADVLGKGAAEGDAFDAALRKSRPGSSRVNQMLEDLNDLAEPKAEEVKPETWVDANGAKHTEPSVPAATPEPIEMNMQKLIEKRQLFRERIAGIKGSTSEDLADKAVYGKLLDGVDDTIGQVAEKSGDPELIDEYKDLRSNYKSRINLYDDPVVKAIINPKGAPDDAARAFIARINQSGLPQSGNVQRNLNVLQKVLDPLGTEGDKPLKEFGGQVFQTLLSDASHEGQFNASKFMDTWKKIDEPTKERLFDAGEDSHSALAEYANDAQSVKNIQRLTRIGLLTAGGAATPLHHVGMGLLGTLALLNENAGVQAGRNLLDFAANHPWTWKTFRGLGHVADSEAAQGVAKVAKTAATNAAGIGVTDTDK